MSLSPIPRTGWTPSPVGYSHIKNVKYDVSVPNGQGGYRYAHTVNEWADTGSVMTIDGKKYCRLYEDKTIAPGFPTCALFISAVSGFLTPAYAGARLTGIFVTSPYYGFSDSASRFVEMIFLMIEYFFAHLATILESLLVSPEPVNGRQWIEEIEQKMNPRTDGRGHLGLSESVWLVNGPMREFPENPLEGGFIWCGCYQSTRVAELDDKNNIIGVRTYHVGSRKQFKIVETSQFEAYPWTRLAQWIIGKCSSANSATPAAA